PRARATRRRPRGHAAPLRARKDVVVMGVSEVLAGVRRRLPAPAVRALDASVRAVARVLPERVRVALGPDHLRYATRDIPPQPAVPPAPVRLYIAPANSAGQGHAWARVAERLPGVGAVSMAFVRPGGFAFDVDDA